jgi:hypothetical protein
MMKLLAALAALLLLCGCSGMTNVIKERSALYGPATLTEPDKPSPALLAYQAAAKAADTEFAKLLADKPNAATVAYVDAGITAINGNCRAWLSAVSYADMRWQQGEANLNVGLAALGAVTAAAKASYDLLTGMGIATTALMGYNQTFRDSVLGMADPALQEKVWQLMSAKAVDIRGRMVALTYPQAADALGEYAALCTPWAAKAAVRSALSSTVTTAGAHGAITSVAK